MTGFLICAALCNLGLGFYLGTQLLLPPEPLPEMMMAAEPDSAPPGELISEGIAPHTSTKTTTENEPHADNFKETEQESSGPCWNNTCTDIRQDIATLYDRIRYSFTANDKKLARMIAAELQQRIPLWQELLEQKLAWNLAELARDPKAKVDCAAPELCLAQTETLQTNLALVDWSDSTDAILKKLEREVEAVKHLLPASC